MTAPTPSDAGARPRALPDRQHRVPRGTGTLGMILFLISLAILFVASIVGFLLINYFIRQPYPQTQPDGSTLMVTRDIPDLHLPLGLWVSTALILASSATVHRALHNVRLERQAAFRRWIAATLVLAVAFVAVQAPSLAVLLIEHGRLMEKDVALYGLVAFLVLVHALHVLGGIGPLFVVTLRAYAGRYDHEHYAPVQYVTMYWHFLDVVWVVMFAVFLLTV